MLELKRAQAGFTGRIQSLLHPGQTRAGRTKDLKRATGPGAVTMNVKTNNTLGYTVTVQAAAATMTGATTGNTDTIPVSALTAKESTGSTYSAISNTAPTTVHSQNGTVALTRRA